MTLDEKQKVFATLLCKLISFINAQGYELSLGEAWRPEITAQWYAEHGKGIAHSLHCERLAIDLCLFKDEVYLTESKDYEFAGRYWEALTTMEFECCWGGRFGDGNHFSISHDGRK